MQVIKGSGYMENMEKEEVDVIRALRGDSFEAKLDSIWKELQSHVDHVLDREMKSSAGVTNRVRIRKKSSKSFCQLGSFRRSDGASSSSSRGSRASSECT